MTFPHASTILPDPLPAGLVALAGEEGSGKTRCLRALAERRADALWLDLALPDRDDQLPRQVWGMLRERWPGWDAGVQQDLAEALQLAPHLEKKLFMLSTGSRRKVALVGLLASGARVTCLDQPFAALDAASARVLRAFLAEQADQGDRTWIVADHAPDPRLSWRRQLVLGVPATPAPGGAAGR